MSGTKAEATPIFNQLIADFFANPKNRGFNGKPGRKMSTEYKLIRCAYKSWQDGKMSSEEFAAVVDKIFCY